MRTIAGISAAGEQRCRHHLINLPNQEKDMKAKILFICQHNSGCGQIAEAYLRKR